MEHNLDPIVDYLYEMGMLAKTPRSGFFFLGSGEQSVAEHINRACYIGFVLASMAPDADMSKVLKMCLFHDMAEARVSDLNWIHQKYTERYEEKAVDDLVKPLPFGPAIKETLAEYEERTSREAILAKDADHLELMLSLKEQMDIGNERAKSWLDLALKRLKTDEGRSLGQKILETDSDRWWFGDKNDAYWIARGREQG